MKLVNSTEVSGTSHLMWALALHKALEKDYQFTAHEQYNCEGIEDGEFDAETVSENTRFVLLEREHALGYIHYSYGTVYLYTFGASLTLAQSLMDALREYAPEEEPPEDNTMHVTFWAHGSSGPVSRRRKLKEIPAWSEIDLNYNEKTRGRLDLVQNSEFRPGKGGQLLLWHGEPGTGKTTALRSLGRAWKDWCEIHYITDPDKFFGAHADYMMEVMAGGSDKKWRLLVLEDTGEFFTVDARARLQNSQGLSRFLNAMDGLLGQGLNFMCLVTTNEELKKLHPAVTRPGRCLDVVEFESLTPEEAIAWAERNNVDRDILQGPMSLADLFATADTGLIKKEEKKFGFALV